MLLGECEHDCYTIIDIITEGLGEKTNALAISYIVLLYKAICKRNIFDGTIPYLQIHQQIHM